MDRVKNIRFFVRDWLEYCKKVLQLQLNVTRIRMDEMLQIQEEGLVSGRVDGALFQKIEGVSRCLFLVGTTKEDEPLSVEADMLRMLLLMQVVNNQYRIDLRGVYDISERFEDDLLNNKVYGVLTSGSKWWFLSYEHSFGSVKCKLLAQKSLEITGFFDSLQEVNNQTIDCISDLIFNKCKK